MHHSRPFADRDMPPVRIYPMPFRNPLAAFSVFSQDRHAVLLDSAAPDATRGRYTYIATDPFRLIEAHDDGVRVDGAPVAGDPFLVLERELASGRVDPAEGPVPFMTGAIGFLGYELGRHLERLPESAPNDLGIPEMVVGLYDVIVAFDVIDERCWVISSGRPETDPEAATLRAERRALEMMARIEACPDALPACAAAAGVWHEERSRDEIEADARSIMGYINAGDIYQANLTHRVHGLAMAGLDDFTLYRRLRSLSPAPFAAFLRCGRDLSVICASPERFLQLRADGMVETRPIKGTRPRHPDPARDAALASELAASDKDRAENLMIVDLMRNDIGRVCETGSVTVPVLNGLESFASVHHLVSVVQGRLRRGLGPVDLLRATFPGGSITGAPKIRAMEIIRELEPTRRHVYCGSILWIGFDGAMDSNIVIRTLTRAGNMLLAQAGGGVVADSDPAAEYDESRVKMAPLLRALTEDRPC